MNPVSRLKKQMETFTTSLSQDLFKIRKLEDRFVFPPQGFSEFAQSSLKLVCSSAGNPPASVPEVIELHTRSPHSAQPLFPPFQ